MQPQRPTIAISMGDPAGIGPEVIVKALADADLRKKAHFHIYGTAGPLHTAALAAGIDPFWWQVRSDSPIASTASVHEVLLLDHAEFAGSELSAGVEPRPTKAGGEASFTFVENAIRACKPAPGGPGSDAMHADALVTGPISKEAWALAGRRQFPGHTELLAARFGARSVRMMFDSPRLRTILATTHIPLMQVGGVLTIGRISDTIDAAHEACRRLGVTAPRIAVCGLNPHAGENGLMGDEDQRVIEPAIRHARERGIEATGPWPGDTIFTAAVNGRYDIVVAMYHDQGLIPIKLLAFDRAVNVSLGLPTVRTSPDHGTAFDIAGKNLADPGSMRAALDLAIRLAAARATEQHHALPGDRLR